MYENIELDANPILKEKNALSFVLQITQIASTDE